MFDIYVDDLVRLRVQLLAQVVTGAWDGEIAESATAAAAHLEFLAESIEHGGEGAATFAPLDTASLARALQLLAHHKRQGTLPVTKGPVTKGDRNKAKHGT